MEQSCINSKTLEKLPNLSFGILIQNLPENLKTDAITSLKENFGILPSSVVCVKLSKLGVNVIFDKYDPFYKAVTARVLLVQCIMFKMYPMLTDLTIIGAAPYLTQNTIKSLMAEIAPVWSVYAEVDIQTGPTTNYRVIMKHPEIPDHIKLWPLCNFNMIGNNTSFPITFFCRLCRQNGHTRHQCNISAQRSNDKLLELELIDERRKLEEERRKLEEERQKFLEERQRLQVQEEIKIKNGKIKTETNCLNRPETSFVKTHLPINLPFKPVRETSKKCKKITFSKLIPSELRITEKSLKELFLNIGKEDSSKVVYDKAQQYPRGINILLRHLNEVVEFNLKVMSSRNSSERAHIIWIDSVYGKIKEEHSKLILEETDGFHLKSGKSCTIIKEEPVYNNESNSIYNYNQKSDQVEDNISKSDRHIFIKQEWHDVKHQNQDEKVVVSIQEHLHQESKEDVKDREGKDVFSTTTTQKPSAKKQVVPRKPSKKFSPGLSAALRCSKGVLKSSELKAFLIYVRGKKHVWKTAKNYTLNVHGLIEQLQVIVHKQYQALKVSSATHKEIAWIKELIERLKVHANCESCNT